MNRAISAPNWKLISATGQLIRDRVLSTGTFLDTLRFRVHLARQLNIAPLSIEAQVLGEHGTSQVFIWSSATVAGMPLRELVARVAGGGNDPISKSETHPRP